MRVVILFLLIIPNLIGDDPAAWLNEAALSRLNTPAWLKLCGEYRVRVEGFSGRGFAPGNQDHYVLNRVRFGVRVQPASWIGFDAQLQDARVFAADRAVAGPPLQDRADIRVAFVELGNNDRLPFALRIGRQEISFGEERLIGKSNWGNTGRSFDAIRLVLRRGPHQVEAFASSAVRQFDPDMDHRIAGDNLHGVAGVVQVGPKLRLEPHAFWRVAPLVAAERAGSGNLDLKTLGGRIVAPINSETEIVSEIYFQRGSWGGDPVSGWATYLRVVRKLGQARWSPAIRQDYNFATGDENPADGRHGTFELLYPTPHDKYGLADQVGWKNIHHWGSTLEFNPAKQLILQGKYHMWWLASERDGLYHSSGALQVRDPLGRSGRFVGREIDVQVLWNPGEQLKLGGGVGHIFPGTFLKNTTPGNSYTFPYVMITYSF